MENLQGTDDLLSLRACLTAVMTSMSFNSCVLFTDVRKEWRSVDLHLGMCAAGVDGMHSWSCG